ncbi:MAG: MIP/aquaporin family protein [Oscillospiraceae bacterium]
MNSTSQKYIGEALGTFILVFFGCGTAMVTGNLVAIALAFGISIIVAAYTVGKASGCHLNPAVSFAMLVSGKMKPNEFIGYTVSQVIGAFAASFTHAILVWCGCLGEDYEGDKLNSLRDSAFGANGFGDMNFFGALLTEIILTFIFVLVVLAVVESKEERVNKNAPIFIGVALTFVHLLGIGLTGTSVNPARSIAPAFFAISNTDWSSLAQLWVFIVGPLAGAFLASVVNIMLVKDK